MADQFRRAEVSTADVVSIPTSGAVNPRRALPPAASHAHLSSSGKRPRTTIVETAVPRLALSKREGAQSLGVSLDFFEGHVMHELRIVRRGRRRLIPVAELSSGPSGTS